MLFALRLRSQVGRGLAEQLQFGLVVTGREEGQQLHAPVERGEPCVVKLRCAAGGQRQSCGQQRTTDFKRSLGAGHLFSNEGRSHNRTPVRTTDSL